MQITTTTDLGRPRFERRSAVPGVLWDTKTAFHCHERGVVVTTGQETRRLTFGDLEAFAFEKIALYASWGYGGTQYNLSFRARGSGQKALEFACVTQPLKTRDWLGFEVNAPTHVDDPDLELLADELSLVLARRMMAELEATGCVAWTPRLRLTREGLEYPAGRKGVARASFAEIGQCSATNGVFYIQLCRGRSEAIEEQIGVWNFHPGLRVLNALLGDSGAGRQAEGRA